MKKLKVLAIFLAISLLLCACGEKSDEQGTNDTAQTSEVSLEETGMEKETESNTDNDSVSVSENPLCNFSVVHGFDVAELKDISLVEILGGELTIGDTTVNIQDNDDYNLATTGAWKTNTCHNDKYMVTVNSKTAGHPDGAAMSKNYYYKERAIGDFIEEMTISVSIHFCQDSLLDIHPDYMDYTPVNCFGRDGYYKEIQDEDFIEFLSEREINMGRFDGHSGIAIFYPCYDDMYLVAVIEYLFPFINDPNDAMADYYVEDGFIYDENDNKCVEYEAFDLKKLFNDSEFLEFDVIEVSEM